MRLDLTGHTYGSLTVLYIDEKNSIPKNIKWICLCSCGKTCSIRRVHLRSGHTKSCGCISSALTIKKNKLRSTHGSTINHNPTPEYQAWVDLRRRCTVETHSGYKDYGGRGITVCDRWLNSFESFLEDMGTKPEGTSIDRLNNNGPYCLENCRWATKKEQQRNRRSAVLVTIGGITMPLIEAVEKYAVVPYATVQVRLQSLGWDIIRALITPSKRK